MGIDQQIFGPQDHLETIYFEGGLMNNTIKRTLKIRNLTSVKVNYHWDIHKLQEKFFSIDDQPRIFRIEPSQGEFPPQSQLSFDIFFTGLQPVRFLSRSPISRTCR